VDSSFGEVIFNSFVKGLSSEIARKRISDVDCFYGIFGEVCTYMFENHSQDINESNFITSISEIIEISLSLSTRASSAPALCGQLLGRLLLLPLPETVSEGILSAFVTTSVNTVTDSNNLKGNAVEGVWKCLCSALETCNECNTRDVHVGTDHSIMKSLELAASTICVKSFTIATEEMSVSHMKLFAATMEVSYKWHLDIPEFVTPLLCTRNCKEDIDLSLLFNLHFSTLKNLCSTKQFSHLDLLDPMTSSMVWIAARIQPYSASMQHISDFSQVYPVVLPVFFTKLLNSPLKDCAVEILLPSLINSKQLPVLCEISFGYDILRKLLTCEGDWVSIESSQQLLYNILRVCVDLLDQSKLEDLTSDKIQYFQLLSNASSKIVNPLLLPCIEKLVLSLIQLLLSTHDEPKVYQVLCMCCSHLLGLHHTFSESHSDVFSSVCDAIWSTIKAYDSDKFYTAADLYARLVKAVPDIDFFDVFSTFLHDHELLCLSYPSSLIVKSFTNGQKLFLASTMKSSLVSSEVTLSYRKILLMAQSLAGGLPFCSSSLRNSLKHILVVLAMLSWGCHWSMVESSVAQGTTLQEEKYCKCIFQDCIHMVLVVLSTSHLLATVVKEMFDLSNSEGGLKSMTFSYILWSCYTFEDIDTACLADFQR
jgi:hypothetical protein